MKKKKLLIVTAGFIVLAGIFAGLFFLLPQKDEKTATQTPQVEPLSKQLDKACQVFTEAKAKELLGASAVKSDQSNAKADSFSNDIAASQCVYTEKAYDKTAPPESQMVASIIARSPRTDAGKTANQSVFADGSLPEGAVKVSGYGDSAFWNKDYGQLNILKDGEWYVLDYGTLLPSTRSQAETEKFASILKDNL